MGNMALASDTLFDKFGLFDNTGNVLPSTSHSIEPEYPGLSTLPTFENLQELDFAELLEIKEEPDLNVNNSSNTNQNNQNNSNTNSVSSPNNITSTELDNLAKCRSIFHGFTHPG